MAHKKNKKVVKKVATKPKAPREPTLQEMCPVRMVMQSDVDSFKLVTNLSNACSAVVDDISKKELAIKQMQTIADKINDGIIKPPLMQQIAPGVFGQFHNMKDTLKQIKSQVDQVELTVKIAKGQLPHRHDEYVDALILFRNKLNAIIGDAKVSSIAEQRSSITKGDEKILFEQSFEDFQKTQVKDKLSKELKKKKYSKTK